MRKFFENFFVWLSIIVFVAFIYDQLSSDGSLGKVEKLAFSQFLDKLDSGHVTSVTIRAGQLYVIEGQFRDGTLFRTQTVIYNGLIEKLEKNGVVFEFITGETVMGFLFSMVISWLPMLIIIGVWLFFMKQMNSSGNKAMSFTNSKAKMVDGKKRRVLFKDVAGIEEAKEELSEIVDFLKDPMKFRKLGGKIPKGCLLIGPPGTGKTLLAKAVAGEASVPYLLTAGSEFVEMFVGVGASRIRQTFNMAKKNAPCVIFIDEIDAVGRHRGAGIGGGNDEREQTLNQLLVEMDGFESNEGIIILAATNRPDVLDHALLRPGRFDRQVDISLPDIQGREKILNVHLKKILSAPDVDSSIVARGTPGFSGADLANLVNESALIAARRDKRFVTMEDFEYARDKVMMGLERRSLIMKEEEKKLTAYHEAGHALVSIQNKASDPIHKATIIPRGRALGLVMRLPETDRVSITKEKMIADIEVALGGRISEEIVFGENKITSGASSDIQQLTKIARAMVMDYGMSDKVGLQHYSSRENENKLISLEKMNLIDSEIEIIISDARDRVRKILESNRKELDKLANALLKYETLTGDQIQDVLAGKEIKISNDENKEKVVKKSSFLDENDLEYKSDSKKADTDTGEKEEKGDDVEKSVTKKRKTVRKKKKDE
ncbi:ATP-dependent zinc metalloprotease FtsH [Anaplasmataceae bacterium AB001_6]|nr:ATP-dependent zinc metalloprotease FtsH [Anaplasmataceae bacterium AB001_6]